MIVVLGSVLAREGCVPQVLALSREHVNRSRAEPGCVSHAVHQDAENPQRLVFVEQWASKDALWQHFKIPASRSFAKSVAALAAEVPNLSIYEATLIRPPDGKS